MPESKRPKVATQDIPKSVLDNLLEGCQVVDPTFTYVYVNEALVRQGKTTREALLGRTMMERYPGIENTEMFSLLRACMTTRSPATMENEFTFPGGEKGWFELRFEPVPEGVALLSIDVSDRKRSELALQRAHRDLTIVSSCNHTLARAKDERAFAEDVCKILVECGGYAAASITTIRDKRARAEESISASFAHTDAKQPPSDSDTLSDPYISVEIPGKNAAVGTLCLYTNESHSIAYDEGERELLRAIARDVGYGVETLRAQVEHERTERQLAAIQRLEAVGRLAGGIAHDFNNLMSIVLSYAWLAMRELPEGSPLHADIDKMRGAGERAGALTKQLLAFSRKQIMEPQVTNINEVVRGIETMLSRLLGDDMKVRIHAASDLGNIMIDPGQLEQVIMNLAVNARDAMPRGGKLTFETDNQDVDEQYAGADVSLAPGRYVRLSVTDTGVGMPREVRDRAFEPFFTTKGPGAGTGLGLSTVYGIVKQSSGAIWIYSEPGRGTTFKLFFPRVDAPVAEHRPAKSVVTTTRGELILLVEDEEFVRIAAERILRAVGYRVLSVGNGGEALLCAELRDGQVDLLLTDMVMPDLSGPELAERVRAMHPNTKVLFSSGYTDHTIADYGDGVAPAQFLSKPFSAVELTNRVRDVLGRDS